jgi:hypothetical protein
MSRIGFRRVRAGAAIVASGVLVLSMSAATAAPATPSAATPPSSFGAPPIIPVDMTTDGGFTLPATAHAGFVTFRVTTPETGYHALQGFRVKNGATPDDVVADLAKGLSGDRTLAAEGATALLQHAVLIGGVVPTDIAPISSTVLMTPGTYYFFDLNDLFITGLTPRVHTMQVLQPNRLTLPPRADGAIVLQTHSMEGDDHHAIQAPANMKAKGTYLVLNVSGEVHEAVWRQVQPGITDEYLTTYYTAIRNGTPRPPAPWLTSQRGLQAISPGQFAYVTIDLPPALYALLCIVPSAENGWSHSTLGMRKVVTLN